MKQSDNSIPQVLAQYVFRVADHYLESVGPATQSALIDLYTTVEKSAGRTATVTILGNLQASEWEQVLQEPIDWQSVHRQWLAGIYRVRLNRSNQHVARLERIIANTNYRLQQVQISHLSEPRRSKLEAYYQHILGAYQQQLAQALTIRASILAYVSE